MILRKLALQSFFTTFMFCIAAHTLPAQSVSKEQLTEDLFTSKSPDEFSKALTLATQEKLPPQTILEARFIHHVDQADSHALAQLSKELLPLQDSFDSKLSQIFTLEDDWKAIVKYTVALNNLEQGDAKAFETNIKEAFWLSPRQASAFAPHVEQFKTDLAMQAVKISPELTQKNLLADRDEKILEPEKKINILFFWSPWSREFSETVDDFTALCTLAKKHQLTVRTLIAEQSDEVNQDAISFIKESKLTDSALWLKEEPSLQLSTTLRIQTIPTVVLIDTLGKVHFNGHPTSPAFWSTLKKFHPTVKRPTSEH